MRKFFKLTHKWLGIPAGLIISIVCITGALLVFKTEVLELANPEHYYVDKRFVGEKPIPLDELMPKVNAQLPEGVFATNVQIFSDPTRTYTMTQSEGFRVNIFVNPYTGEVVGKYDTKESAFWDIMILHRWLMDGTRTWGKYIVGISTLLLTFILISGLFLWFPRHKKQAKHSFKVKSKAGKKRLFYDLHNVLGAYASLILIVCCLTGMMWSFDWYRNSVFTLFGAQTEETESRGGGRGKKEDVKEIPSQSWQKVYEYVGAKSMDNEYVRIQQGMASVHPKSAFTSREQDKYKFDNETGTIQHFEPYADSDKKMKIWGWAYSLHVGEYFGIWSKIFTFLASLIGGTLPLTGFYLYYKKAKRKRSKSKKQIKSVYLPSKV